METVIAVRVLRPYVLAVTFHDGLVREIDVEPLLSGERFAPLADPAVFAQAKVDHDYGRVVWPNGAELAPEILYHGDQNPYAAHPPDSVLDAFSAGSELH